MEKNTNSLMWGLILLALAIINGSNGYSGITIYERSLFENLLGISDMWSDFFGFIIYFIFEILIIVYSSYLIAKPFDSIFKKK